MIPANDRESLALLYHLNSEPVKQADPDITVQPILRSTHAPGDARATALPQPALNSPLIDLLRARRSCRSYRAATLPIAQLSEILRGAYGLTRPDQPPSWLEHPQRPVPSAGALYPLKVYVATGDVEGVENGLHHYNVLDHSLENLRAGEVKSELAEILLDQQQVATACAVIIFTAVFRPSLDRYAARGYRYILLEAGHAAQNVCLLAGELGLGSLCVGGFFDARLNRLIGLDGIHEAAIYCVAVGYASE